MRAIRLAVALSAVFLAAAADAATNSVDRPLLTYAVAPLPVGHDHALLLGLCATDLRGHAFRISDPHDNVGPSWSPDGRSIAFTRRDDTPGRESIRDVFVTDAQGRHPRNLTRFGGRGSFSVFGWSPDGSEVAGNWRGLGTSVFIAKADGTGTRELVYTTYGEAVVGDSLSPDGRRVLFTRWSGTLNLGVYVIDAAGTNERKLVDSAYAAAWSPDGRRFAYLTYGNPAGGLGVADADGSNAHLLLQDVNFIGGPAWAPDGSQLAYVQMFAGNKDGSLGVVRADGTDARLLTDRAIGTPRWSPDGSLIAVTRHPAARANKVAVIKPDGTGEQDVSVGDLRVSDPAWRPAAALPADRRPCVVHGSSRANVVHGTDRGDVIFSGAGNDRVYGGGGDDVLLGGPGRDRLFGGSGGDVLAAQDRARDFLFGGSGRDQAFVDPVDRLRSVEEFHG